MKRLGVVLLVLALAACSRPAPTTPSGQNPQDSSAGKQASIPATSGCNASAAHDWSAVGSQYYMIEAEAHGPTCREAVATMRIKAHDGQTVLFQRSYPVAEVPLAFNPTSDQTGFRSDLEEWTTNVADTPTANWLPAWPSGADHPPFFHPSVSRAQYESFRGMQGPIFCYPDGAESNACVAMNGDHATFLGSRTPERE
ncbi:MAG: hypothetical protein WAU68_01780 [Vitreimonas sp.]